MTEITFYLTDFAFVSVIIVFLLYNFLLIQLSPFLKKYLNKIYDKIKKKRPIGFPIKNEK